MFGIISNVGGLFPYTLATNRAGSFLYVANQNRTISTFAISNSGALSILQGSPFDVGQFSSLMSLTAYPTKSCEPVSNFDICIQIGDSILRINTATGDYQFTNCNGITLTGTGTLRTKGCTVTLTHNASDRRLQAMFNTCQNKGTASVQVLSPRRTFNLTDQNITDGCGCS